MNAIKEFIEENPVESTVIGTLIGIGVHIIWGEDTVKSKNSRRANEADIKQIKEYIDQQPEVCEEDNVA